MFEAIAGALSIKRSSLVHSYLMMPLIYSAAS